MTENWKGKIKTKQDALEKIIEIKKYMDELEEPANEYEIATMLYAVIFIAEVGLTKP